MSKYIKLEDIETLINACEWRMTLAKERHGEGFVDYSKQVLDVDELTKRLSYLPTLEVSEDCISREYIKTLFENNLTGTCKDVVVHTIANAPSVVPTTEQSCDTCKYRELYECSDCRFASKWERIEE